jgi:hypothetical protein
MSSESVADFASEQAADIVGIHSQTSKRRVIGVCPGFAGVGASGCGHA